MRVRYLFLTLVMVLLAGCVASSTNLIAEGICDSLGLVRLAGELEQQFAGLRIQDQDVTHENMGSIRAIAAHVRRAGVAG